MAKDILKGRSIVKKNVFDQMGQSIEEIKRANPLVEYFKSKGVNFMKSGNEYKGLCPFHKDTNPSLSVNEEKQVFKCFGCGKAGTIIDAVSFYENIGNGEAIKLLQEKKLKAREIIFPKVEEPDQEDDLTLKLEDLEAESNPEESHSEANVNDFPPVNPPADGPEFNLNVIADLYHKTLLNSPKALEYLVNRGIKKNIVHYKIGYSDGSLKERAGRSQIQELKGLNLLRDSDNQEYFKGFITIPIFDEFDNVTSFYGRSIESTCKIPHLYLKGKHKGIFNRKASKVYDEIILTESIIDALSLLELDIQNVQAIYGSNGFTDEHLETLKIDRVKTVILAFDKDEAGIKATEKHKETLLNEGLRVKVITPPAHKDWNEELVKNITREQIQTLIDNAISFNPEEKDNEMVVKKEGSTFHFTMNDIIYHLIDVKEVFVTNLKVNIKFEYKGERFPDNLALYSARSRKLYSANIGSMFDIEPKRIEKDLLKILDYLETERDKQLNKNENEVHELSDEERELGMKFLQSPDLFDQIINDLEVMGYQGENLNKILLYLAASSRILDDPISVMIISQSASGKSLLVEKVRKLMPPEDVIAVVSLSDQALNYNPDLIHKFLIMGEAVHNELVEHQVREMLSNKELSRMVAMKNEKTGRTESKQIITKAVVSLVMGGTRYDINPENASRFFIVNTDETLNQTDRIHSVQNVKYEIKREYVKEDIIPELIRKHQSAQRLLKRVRIVIPFGKHLKFPNNTMRTRRDNERFVDLIAVIGFLRQYQKEIKSDGRFEYIECDLYDYRIAYDIMTVNVLPATMQDIPVGAVSLYEEIRKMVKKQAKENDLSPVEVSFIQRELREFTGINGDTIRKNLKQLVDNEYLQLVTGRSRGTRFSYRLRQDESIEKLDLSMIRTPEELKKLMEEDN